MGYERTRSNPKFADLSAQNGDDAAFIKAVRGRVDPNGDPAAFAEAIARNEAQSPGQGTRPTTSASPGTPAPGGFPARLSSIGQTIGGLAKAGGQEYADFGKAMVNAPIEMAKSFANIPRGLLIDPITQIVQGNRAATPQEEQRTASGLGGLLGLAVPGPVAKVAGKFGAGPRLAGALGFGAGGAVDAGIATGGNPVSTATGTGLAALLGALTHGGARVPPTTDTGAVKFDMTPPPENIVYQGRRAGHDYPTPFFTGHKGMAEQFAGPGGKVIAYNEAHIPPEAYKLDERFPQELRDQPTPTGPDYWKTRGEAHWPGFLGPDAPKPFAEYPHGGNLEDALARMHDLSTTGVTPKGGGSALEDLAAPEPKLPFKERLKEGVARSPVGPAVSSATDRLRALGPPGKAIDDMIEQVVQQGQQEPGQYLQPFSETLHGVGGRKGLLPEDSRSLLRGALQGRVDPKTLPENLRPLYDQIRGYTEGSFQKGVGLGVTVPVGGKPVPLEKLKQEHYFMQRPVTLKAMMKDADLRGSIQRNLQDLGLAKDPAEASAILEDQIQFLQSKGKKGGQLAIAATHKLNPSQTPASLRYNLLHSAPPLREPASGLEHVKTINSPFYEPRPEIAFPGHVVDTERALAEIQHYGQDMARVTEQKGKLASSDQGEAQHLIRTMMESHEPGDPRVNPLLAAMRKSQLALFGPPTSLKNLFQRPNNLLTSDADVFLKHGIWPTNAARKIGARSGALAEGAHENLAQALGNDPGAMANWLKIIGFTPAERGNRNTGAATGSAELVKYADRLLKNPQDKLARYRIERAGVDPERVLQAGLNPQIADRAALNKSNRAQFRSHPKDLPDWMTSTPIGRTLGLFKGFDYQQTRLVLDESIGRLTSGQPGDKQRGLRNVAILATVYPAMGEVINDLYSLVSRRESPQHMAARTKEFMDDVAKSATGKMSPVDFAMKYKGRYGEDIIAGSAPGVGGTAVTALNYGKGDRGASVLRQAVGPALSRPAEAVQLAHDVTTQGKPVTGGQAREAMKLGLGGAGTLIAPWIFPPKNAAGEGDTKKSKKGKSTKKGSK